MAAEPTRSAAVLGVGIATRDIVNLVAAYPREDAEIRALAQRTARGGNCANTLDVLAQLGHRCAWAGVLAGDEGAAFIAEDLARRGIDHRHARRIAGGATPTSYITLSRDTGSRTIVHHRDLPELGAADFARVPLAGWDWVHFEGRNPAETAQMLARVRRERPDLPISVEIEKPRDGLEQLFRGVDVLIVARAYAESVSAAAGARQGGLLGADGGVEGGGDAVVDTDGNTDTDHGCGPGTGIDPRGFLRRMAAASDARLCLLPWGAAGAYGLAAGSDALVLAPAHPPAVLHDSLAAGDVFNAAVIDGLLALGGGRDGLTAAVGDGALASLLARANRLAGLKCGREGLEGLAAAARAAGWPDRDGA
ncbi:PfkB family carbohydrate kinase [Thiohalocapsa halophila]|uniref:PfkB family carbohydrate kinase n=1 Tax=Thiohalocapsa halophila TaxID=69359 RepID=UPI001F5B3D86|nr:PfkB family carbohydrate kinase [Thiohalocapsa halophila]